MDGAKYKEANLQNKQLVIALFESGTKIPQEGLTSLRRSVDCAIPDRLKLSFCKRPSDRGVLEPRSQRTQKVWCSRTAVDKVCRNAIDLRRSHLDGWPH